MKTGRIRLAPSFFLLCAGFAVFGFGKAFPLALIAALAHESAHYFAVKLAGGRFSRFELTGFGAVMELAPSPALSYPREILCVLAGAAANIALWAASNLMGWHAFAGANAVLGLYNIIPAPGLDGGRALILIFDRLELPRVGRNISRTVGVIASAVFFAVAIILALTGRLNATVFAASFLLGVSAFASDGGGAVSRRPRVRPL